MVGNKGIEHVCTLGADERDDTCGVDGGVAKQEDAFGAEEQDGAAGVEDITDGCGTFGVNGGLGTDNGGVCT